MKGVASKTGIVIKMKTVWSCVIAKVNTTALDALTNKDRNVPTHVGHAINNPVVAPIPLRPPAFLETEIALIASATLRPTK